ncbi:MAG: acyl-protein synthetase [Bacteroidales bacterium]
MNPFSIDRGLKQEMLTAALQELSLHHYTHCTSYQRIVDSWGISGDGLSNSPIDQLPFLPASLFKSLDLLSIGTEDIHKTLYSSGTTSTKSKIILDKHTAQLQQKAMIKIVQSFTGLQRSPMLVLSSKPHIITDGTYSSQNTLLTGFAPFASASCYAFDQQHQPDLDAIEKFRVKHQQTPGFIIGLTADVWQSLVMNLKKSDITLDFKDWILIHGGGWKKLTHQSVTRQHFREQIKRFLSIDRVYDFYGMIEQTGNLFIECEHGYFHASIFGDIRIRNAYDFSINSPGQSGIVQVLSVLPHSYCGHSLLTGDLGTLYGEDDCPCGRKGKYFRIEGRLHNVEMKGCSNV